jgi:YegS/Rv2252/BmrU family lipid kinase
MEKKIRNIHIIINPGSGKEKSILPVINTFMQAAGIRWEASITHKAGDAIRLTRTASRNKLDAIAVYGGDGTVTEVVNGLVGTEIPLIILPGGSANVIANELGIPWNLKEACALISQNPLRTRNIDVGQLNNRYFIAGISIGFGADLIKGAKREAKSKFGILAYFFSLFTAMQKLKLTIYHLKVDGVSHEVSGITCIVANAGNLGFTKVSLDKHIDICDGLLDIVIVRKADLKLLKLIAITLIKRRRPDNFELVKHLQGKEISISSNHKQIIQCDGEILENLPLHIKIVPGAIRVLIPGKYNKIIAQTSLEPNCQDKGIFFDSLNIS